MGLRQFNGSNQGLATLALDSRATLVIVKKNQFFQILYKLW